MRQYSHHVNFVKMIEVVEYTDYFHFLLLYMLCQTMK